LIFGQSQPQTISIAGTEVHNKDLLRPQVVNLSLLKKLKSEFDKLERDNVLDLSWRILDDEVTIIKR